MPDKDCNLDGLCYNFGDAKGGSQVNTSRFLKACRGEPHDQVPVWFMRQAGRYQPSYRALRTRYTMLELARSPRLIADVTVEAVRMLDVDAAILFSDIMIPLDGLGIRYDIRENVGPIVESPLRRPADIHGMPPFQSDRLEFVYEGVALSVEKLAGVPLIGFAGAPFTLASYLVEGGPSRTYQETKALMWNHPGAFYALMERLCAMVVEHCANQVKAGAAAIQLFDSWVGALSQEDYRTLILPHMRKIFEALKPLGVPLIYFGIGTQHLIAEMARSGATVLGLDWRTALSQARGVVGPSIALMGNLDPQCLLAGPVAVQAGVTAILDAMARDDAYIFNLGHGVPKETDPTVLQKVAAWVHQYPKPG